jgi:hypothetical protein
VYIANSTGAARAPLFPLPIIVVVLIIPVPVATTAPASPAVASPAGCVVPGAPASKIRFLQVGQLALTRSHSSTHYIKKIVHGRR